LNVIIS
jgi:hypothetical protein